MDDYRTRLAHALCAGAYKRDGSFERTPPQPFDCRRLADAFTAADSVLAEIPTLGSGREDVIELGKYV